MILLVTLWTIFWHGRMVPYPQFYSQEECEQAIQEGLPYLGVPPKSELHCGLEEDTSPSPAAPPVRSDPIPRSPGKG